MHPAVLWFTLPRIYFLFPPRFSILKALAGHKGENWRRAFFSRSFVPPAVAAFICLADTAVKI